MANNREIVFRADGRRNPAFLYRDTVETVRMFSLNISLNNAYRKLHRAYDNFTVKPEDMKKLKEEFSNEVVNSIAGHIQKVEATLSKPKEKVVEKKEEVKQPEKKEIEKKVEKPTKGKEVAEKKVEKKPFARGKTIIPKKK